jgi:cytochrome c peroxidase
VGLLILSACRLGHEGFGPAARSRIVHKFERASEAATARGNEVALDRRAARLGQFLFWFEGFTVLDAEDAGRVRPTACVACHEPRRAFTGSEDATALAGHPAARDAPSLYHATRRHFLFWDGRADSAWAQALRPLEDPVEMASNRGRVAQVMHADPELRGAYEVVFGPMPDLRDMSRFPLDAMPAPAEQANLPGATRRKLARWAAACARQRPRLPGGARAARKPARRAAMFP